MKKLIALVAVGLLAACSGSDDEAPTPAPVRLLGTTVPPDSVLVELDATTGEFVKTIGTVGYGVNGLEYDARRGKLYGTTTNWDGRSTSGGAEPLRFPSGLISIDMKTGAGTPIGSSNSDNITNLTVNKAGQLYSWTETTDDLVTLSTTGVATVVGDSGLDTGSHGLAFDNSDHLWFFNYDWEVYAMDLATGVASTVGSITDDAHHGDFHPRTGKYWGLDWSTPRNLNVVSMDPLEITTTLATGVDELHVITFTR
jgi:hypothetical protein